MDEMELRWNCYKMEVGLYRSYLELILKANLFYYAITGAIVSFYLAHPVEFKYALWIPMFMSTAFAVLFVFGANRAKVLRDHIIALAQALNIISFPEVRILKILRKFLGKFLENS